MSRTEAGTESKSKEFACAGLQGDWFRSLLRPEFFLAVAAAILLIDHARIALAPEDAEPAETPLVLSIARQAVHGPEGLYGPFSGKNPLVLIHAPLYYRIAGAVAWCLIKTARVEPIEAALVAGRAISFVSFLALLLAIAVLTTLDGAPGRAAVWSVLFVAATPLIVDFAIPSRADLFAVAAQTWARHCCSALGFAARRAAGSPDSSPARSRFAPSSTTSPRRSAWCRSRSSPPCAAA